MARSAEARVAPAPGTVWEPVGEELVVWSGKDRTLHRLDRVGRWLWDLLDGGLTIGEVAEQAASVAGPEHAAQARRDAADFVDSLQQRDLVRLLPLSDRGQPLIGDGA